MCDDLDYLISNPTALSIQMEADEALGLLSEGWLTYQGQAWGTIDKPGQLEYGYTKMAKLFRRLVLSYSSK